MSERARRLIEDLALQPHPEGGHYSETWRARETVTTADGRLRPAGTAIHYLLSGDDRSRLHRLRSDEVWHLYEGGPVHLHLFDEDGSYRRLDLGDGKRQAVVPAGCRFGAELADGAAYALTGCTLAPGFEFADFELVTPDELLASHPDRSAVIRRLV